MKIIHVTAWHNSIVLGGGTEKYIEDLCDQLAKSCGVTNRTLVVNRSIPQHPARNCRYFFPTGDNQQAVAEFKQEVKDYLTMESPDVLFFHSSNDYEGVVAQIAQELSLPFFFFFHAPYWLCNHYDLKFCGKSECQRILSLWRCTFCLCKGRMLSIVKVLLGELLRLLRLRKTGMLDQLRNDIAFKSYIVRNASRIIVFTTKDKQLFVENRIQSDKIFVLPQGLSDDTLRNCAENMTKPRTGRLQIGYVGRTNTPVKGVQHLIPAAAAIPQDMEFDLHVYGCVPSSESYLTYQSMARGDPRIHFHEQMPSSEVIRKYGELDVLCIPSIVFETGPLTLLEGVYSGCLVAGSDQIGQMSFLLKYGRLITPNTSDTWKSFFMECIAQRDSIRKKRQREIDEVRSQAAVAHKLVELAQMAIQ